MSIQEDITTKDALRNARLEFLEIDMRGCPRGNLDTTYFNALEKGIRHVGLREFLLMIL
ncbi:MAG: hypothetical protein MZV49_05490 [Rhodopseudomonas palustris]|nr:hypothetical protein [Rhodopseudomonas palustris]